MKLSKNVENSLLLLVLTVGIIAVSMVLFPAMAFPDADSAFLGYEIAFGTEFANLGGFVTGQVLGNILGVLAYLLPMIAGLLVIFVKKSSIVSAILFAAGAVLLLTMPEYTITTVTILNTSTEVEIDWVLSYGLMIAASCSIIGVIATLFQTYFHFHKA